MAAASCCLEVSCHSTSENLQTHSHKFFSTSIVDVINYNTKYTPLT